MMMMPHAPTGRRAGDFVSRQSMTPAGFPFPATPFTSSSPPLPLHLQLSGSAGGWVSTDVGKLQEGRGATSVPDR